MRHVNPYGRARREKPWPLRRAEIVRKLEVDRERERRMGFLAGVEAVASQYVRDARWQSWVYDRALRELADRTGQAIGQAVAAEYNKHFAALDRAMSLQQAMIDGAMSRLVLDAGAHGLGARVGDMTYTEIAIRMAPVEFSYRIPGPRIDV